MEMAAERGEEVSREVACGEGGAMGWTVYMEPPGGPVREEHAAVAIGDRVFSFGGSGGDGMGWEPEPMVVYILNTSSYRWTEVAPPTETEWPVHRCGHTAVAWREAVYLFGGWGCNALYKFDPALLTWSRPQVSGEIPGARVDHSACVIGDHMFVFGGRGEQVHRDTNVYRLDLRTLTWERLACTGAPPGHTEQHSATALGARMVVARGVLRTGGSRFAASTRSPLPGTAPASSRPCPAPGPPTRPSTWARSSSSSAAATCGLGSSWATSGCSTWRQSCKKQKSIQNPERFI